MFAAFELFVKCFLVQLPDINLRLGRRSDSWGPGELLRQGGANVTAGCPAPRHDDVGPTCMMELSNSMCIACVVFCDLSLIMKYNKH